jgi:hypothetical protein
LHLERAQISGWGREVIPRSLIALLAAGALAAPAGGNDGSTGTALPDNPFATFVPNKDTRRHRIDYTVWTEALQAFVVSMGPPLRRIPPPEPGPNGTRIRIGHNSIYRLDGAMVGFSLMDREVIANIGQYRRDLEAVADGLDIQSLPRNEQLAYWLNLHNVAMVEKVAEVWPIRQPREILVAGVPLDEARFITVEGVALSPRDIREKIVYANWKSPEVIYGFWRGEIGGPAMQRQAFEGRDLSQQLERAASEFANSRRGAERRGDTLHVSRFYSEAAPFFFPDFEADLRAHLGKYVEGKVAEMLAETEGIKASLSEYDIADLSGGYRANAFFSNGRLNPAAVKTLAERQRKLEYIERKLPRTGTVIFSNIDLPGDPPNKGEVE